MAEEIPTQDEFPVGGDLDQKRAWLNKKMKGMRAPSRTLLAGRAALRALPALHPLAGAKLPGKNKSRSGTDLILPVFRAMFLSSVAPLAPSGENARWQFSADFAADSAFSASDSAYSASDSAYSAAYSAAFSAASAAYSAAASADFAASSAAGSAGSAGSAAAFDFDCTHLRSLGALVSRRVLSGALASRRVLAASPLWPQGMQSEKVKEWAAFSAKLRGMGDGWSIWAEWYEGILAGERDGRFLFGLPTHRALKLWQDVALIDNAIWEAGPATLNAEFRRLVDEALAELSQATLQFEHDQPDALAPPPADIPPQNTKSSTFALTEDGRIGRAPVAPEQALLQSAAQLDRYAEMRTKLHELLELGDNSLGVLAKPATEFLKVLPEDLSQANADLLWARANKLRRLHRGHELALTDRDPNPARLAFDCGEALGDLIDMYNVFAFGDPAMTLRDATRFGPRDRADALAELASAKPVTDKALASEDVLTKEAHSDLSTQDANIKDLGEGIHSDQAVEQARIAKRNFIGTALSAAFDVAKKADGTLAGKNGGFAKETSSHLYKRGLDGALITLGVGASAAAASHAEIVYFVLANADALKAYSAMYLQGSSAVRIVDWIRLQMEPKVE